MKSRERVVANNRVVSGTRGLAPLRDMARRSCIQSLGTPAETSIGQGMNRAFSTGFGGDLD